jgi:predicted transcriptional regulator
MATLTIRLPDDKHDRLRRLAQRRRISMNKLMEELSTIAIVQTDIEARFHARGTRGSRQKALKLLDKLDARSPAR